MGAATPVSPSRRIVPPLLCCWSFPDRSCSPYDTTKFASFAEPVPEVGGAVDDAASPTLAMLAAAAKEHGVFLVGGE